MPHKLFNFITWIVLAKSGHWPSGVVSQGALRYINVLTRSTHPTLSIFWSQEPQRSMQEAADTKLTCSLVQFRMADAQRDGYTITRPEDQGGGGWKVCLSLYKVLRQYSALSIWASETTNQMKSFPLLIFNRFLLPLQLGTCLHNPSWASLEKKNTVWNEQIGTYL